MDTNKDKFTLIKRDGSRGEFRGLFAGSIIMTEDKTLHFEADDEIERRLPNGTDEVFVITDPQFFGVGSFGPHYQIKFTRKGMRKSEPAANITHNYHLTGDNARVTHGVDQSVNTVKTSINNVFADMRQVVKQNSVGQQTELLEKLDAVEKAQNKTDAMDKWNKFMESASKTVKVATAVAPLMSRAYAWIYGLP